MQNDTTTKQLSDDTLEQAQLAERNRRWVLRMTGRPVSAMRCEVCGGSDLIITAPFSAGMGLAYRPVADACRCLRCGHVGNPLLREQGNNRVSGVKSE